MGLTNQITNLTPSICLHRQPAQHPRPEQLQSAAAPLALLLRPERARLQPQPQLQPPAPANATARPGTLTARPTTQRRRQSPHAPTLPQPALALHAPAAVPAAAQRAGRLATAAHFGLPVAAGALAAHAHPVARSRPTAAADPAARAQRPESAAAAAALAGHDAKAALESAWLRSA